MKSNFTTLTTAIIIATLIGPVLANENFTTGPVFKEYGENIKIEGGLKHPAQQQFKVVFDVYKENETDKPHRGFNSIARFINMHVRAGVPQDNVEVALVVHGKAAYGLLKDNVYREKFGTNNPSSELLSQLLENNVRVIACGQSSSYLGIGRTELIDDVELSLSAMTANALLQQAGYTLNPF